MAVVPMKKVGIIGYKPDWNAIVEALQQESVVHVEPINPPDMDVSDLETKLSRLDSAAKFVVENLERKPPKPILSPKQVENLIKKCDIDKILSELEKLKDERDKLSSEANRIKSKIETLYPWKSCPLPLKDIGETNYTRIIAGTVPQRRLNELAEKLEENELAYFNLVSITHEGAHLIVVFHKDAAKDVEQILTRYEFARWEPREFVDTAANEIKKLEQKFSELEQKLSKITSSVRGYGDFLPSLWAAADSLEQTIAQYNALSTALKTDMTFAIQGWVPKQRFERLKRKLEATFETVEVLELPVLPEDDPPVALKNPRLIEPFEVVTDLYGRPVKGMVDPTPFIAPFFAIYFALCLTDAGYGLILTLIALLGLKKFKAPGTRKFLRMILYVGIATIGAGIITGSYFGIALPEPSKATGLAAFALKLKLFDPLNDIMLFFAISIAFGAVQLSIGFLLSLYIAVKRAKSFMRKFHGVFVNIAWVVETIGLGLFLIHYVVPDKVPGWGVAGVSLIKLGAAGIVLGHSVIGPLAGYSIAQSIGKALAFDGLYGIIGLFSDILSFVRITALGLSTSIVAGVITDLTTKMKGALFILGILVLIGGHLFYSIFSALGAFVHPARLQFVEFFGKFYEAGGRNFEPFRRKYKRLEVI